jgi:hypothetical protein
MGAVPIERVPRATRDETVVDLLARLDESQPPRAIVQEGDVILGLVTPEDVARAFRAGRSRRVQWAVPSGTKRPTEPRGEGRDPLRP